LSVSFTVYVHFTELNHKFKQVPLKIEGDLKAMKTCKTSVTPSMNKTLALPVLLRVNSS